jgi:uncharacterized protein (DUF488 family)
VETPPASETAATDLRPIFTIGHGAESFGELARRCGPHRITTIVDVRSRPYSRHAPDFRKERLEGLCAEAGLGYRWLGNLLGGLPGGTVTDRSDWSAVAASPGFLAGIAELEGLAANGRIVLLCAEVDPAACHRSLLVAPTLTERGYPVRHIVADGTTRAHQPSLDW